MRAGGFKLVHKRNSGPHRASFTGAMSTCDQLFIAAAAAALAEASAAAEFQYWLRYWERWADHLEMQQQYRNVFGQSVDDNESDDDESE
jgi:hypothetical protein